MTHRSRPGSAALVAVLALVLTGPGGAPATAAGERPGHGGPTKGRVSYGATTWTAGTSGYSIKGKAPGPRRKVALQVKWADGWHTIDKTRTKRRGKYHFTGSFDWYGAHKLRVLVPRKKRFAAKAFKAKKFTVAVPWTPRGATSSYLPFSDRGLTFRWNPCETVKYRINPGLGGPAAVPITLEAMELLERATGFTSKYVGTTTAVPIRGDRYPRGTDLVIAWSHQDLDPALVGTVGRGGTGPSPVAQLKRSKKPTWRIKHPGVTMNMAYAAEYPMAMDWPTTEPMGLVLIHELGHAFGLAHFSDDIQIMHSGPRSPAPGGYFSRYEAGDLAGLASLGAAKGCLTKYRGRFQARAGAGVVTPGTVSPGREVIDLVEEPAQD
jgi:hypothetical protein